MAAPADSADVFRKCLRLIFVMSGIIRRMPTLTRRDFLGVAATAIAAGSGPQALAAQAAPIPIIDTHIHLFDPTRPHGAPYSGPRVPGVAPIPAYPDRYRKLAIPLGAVGAIKVEASPWVEDNLWVLDVAQRDTIIVGVIGNLEPDKPEFKEYFDRYRKHPLFRGIRYGNLWGRDPGRQADNPVFIDGLKLLADADLVLDTANPRMALLDSMLKISDKVPTLRIVLDHLPNFEPTPAERPAYDAALREFAKRPQVYVKLSAILRRVDGKVSTEVSSYRDTLDRLVGTFKPNHQGGGDTPTHNDRLQAVTTRCDRRFLRRHTLSARFLHRAATRNAFVCVIN
jgi:predicted TIM-barrel fold metal-dependent hydrolase